MPILLQAILLSFAAGIAIPVGGLISSIENIRPRWLQMEFRHSVIAFGGGVLISAVCLVLVPEGIETLSLLSVTVSFLICGLMFMLLDKLVSTSIGPASQLIAMLIDFIPEALALGATFSLDRDTGLLLAILICLQNLPEGFNAYREIISDGKYGKRFIILLFSALSLLGPLCAYTGLTKLAGKEDVLGVIMLSSAAGILYLTFQDIAPQAKLKNQWAPSFGAVAGFMVGLVGHMILKH